MTVSVGPATVGLPQAFRAALAGVPGPFLLERSVKVAGERIAEGRYLLSVPRAALAPGAKARLRAMMSSFGTPPELLAQLDAHQAAADFVHLGLEPGTDEIRKAYLEFAPDRAPEPGLVFLAAKWRTGQAGRLSFYTRRSGVEARALLQEVTDDALVLVFLNGRLQTDETLRVLEVTEQGTPRRSLDVNLADTGIALANAIRALGLAIPLTAYSARYGHEDLGHVAVGRGSDGMGFVTLYHGAREMEAPV